MSQNENDDSIKVNIRTGTSTRAPQLRTNTVPREHIEEVNITFEIGGNIPMNSYQGLMLLMHLANRTRNDHTQETIDRILEQSFQDGEIKRDPNIQLDIESHNCHTEETENTCTVCQHNFKLGEKLSTLEDCDHTFHFTCLKEWGKYKQECPLCRCAIPVLER